MTKVIYGNVANIGLILIFIKKTYKNLCVSIKSINFARFLRKDAVICAFPEKRDIIYKEKNY